jgi:Asp-tRNA(Asn)/Glu-tRNA(Gln) amidotransferase A subunit family amidase
MICGPATNDGRPDVACMRPDEFKREDALGLAELIRTRQVAATEVLDAAIEAIEQSNGTINAVVLRLYDEARASLRQGTSGGQFDGVPFLVKDLGAQLTGTVTSNGSRLFRGVVADHDSTLIKRHRAAGLVICGKTNAPGMGLATTTEPMLHGPTRNPHNPEHTAGGSSGGAAAAVAAGYVPIAHATDGGGSIRIPASCCGLFGLKPSRGRVPLGPDQIEGWGGLSTAHAVSRTVRDSAAMLDATAGEEPGAPYCAPPRARSYLLETAQSPGKLRIALCTTPFNSAAVDPVVKRATEQAATAFASLGHEVVEAQPTIDRQAVQIAHGIVAVSHMAATVTVRAAALGREPGPDLLEAATLRDYAYAHQLRAVDYARASGALRTLGVDLASFFTDYDVLLTPTLACLPPKLGEIDTMSDDAERFIGGLLRMIGFTAICNDSGIPAVSLPLAVANGLPIGIQCAAAYGNEALLVRLAAQVEAARLFVDRY